MGLAGVTITRSFIATADTYAISNMPEMNFDQSSTCAPKPPVTVHLASHINKESTWDHSQTLSPLLAVTYNHAPMQLAPSAFAPRLSTLAPELIDRALDHGLIGKKWLDKPPRLLGEPNEGSPKPTEFLPVCFSLYYH